MENVLPKQDRIGITKKIWGEFILIFIIFVLILFLFENSFITPAVIINPFDFISFFVIFCVSIALIITHLILTHYHIQFRSEITAICILAFIIISNTVVMGYLPVTLVEQLKLSNGDLQTIVVSIDMVDRLRSFLLSISACLFIYVMVFVFPKQKNARAIIFLAAIALIAIGYIFIAHSLITEMDKYVKTITDGISAYAHVPNGLFINRNLFASYLFVSFLSCFYLWTRFKKLRWLFILLSIPFAVIIFFTVSKTKIIMFAFVYLAILVFWLVNLLPKHKIIFSFALPLSVLTIAALIVFRLVPSLETTFLGKLLNDVLPDSIFVTNSLQSRLIIWRYAFSYLDEPFSLIFGRGFYISKMLLGTAMAYEPASHFTYRWGNFHNGFIEVISTGGLILLIPYLAFIGYLIYVNIKIAKFNKYVAFYSLVALTAFIIHSMFESVSLLLFNAEGIIHALPVVSPALAYYHKLKKDKLIVSKWDAKHENKPLFAFVD